MPKLLYTKVTVRTYETYSNTEEEGIEYIKKFEEGETEESEPGVKAKLYKLGWIEFDTRNPTEQRDLILAAFLKLMQQTIPGMPPSEPEPVEENKIIKPYDPFRNKTTS